MAEHNLVINHTRNIWLFYNQWDPLFNIPPMWLRVMCTIEVFIFGPLYTLTAYGMYKDTAWFAGLALPFAGALIYSTIVYFAMEIILNEPGTNITMVFVVNLPWTIIPMMLVGKIVVVLTGGGVKGDGKVKEV